MLMDQSWDCTNLRLPTQSWSYDLEAPTRTMARKNSNDTATKAFLRPYLSAMNPWTEKFKLVMFVLAGLFALWPRSVCVIVNHVGGCVWKSGLQREELQIKLQRRTSRSKALAAYWPRLAPPDLFVVQEANPSLAGTAPSHTWFVCMTNDDTSSVGTSSAGKYTGRQRGEQYEPSRHLLQYPNQRQVHPCWLQKLLRKLFAWLI